MAINARTGRRHPIWAEIDSNARRTADRVPDHPPREEPGEGERYIVALRNLLGARGKEIEAGRGFRIYRDRIETGARPIERRRPHFEQIFRALRKAGVERGELYLAWDFTVASERSLAGRMLHIRDDAFGILGDRNLKDLKVAGNSPAFIVDAVTDFTSAEDDRIARTVEGRLTVPCYLTNGCAPGGSFRLDRRGRSDRGEANGYAHHMTSDPLPNTPRHNVLMHVAFGDHQVADITAEVEARTIGARAYRPAVVAGRSPWSRFQLIPSIGSFPFSGSAIVMWDTGPIRMEGTETQGTGPAPTTNTPNRQGDDPHDNPRATPSARVQKSEFLKVGGRVVDLCGGQPCYAAPYTGP